MGSNNVTSIDRSSGLKPRKTNVVCSLLTDKILANMLEKRGNYKYKIDS